MSGITRRRGYSSVIDHASVQAALALQRDEWRRGRVPPEWVEKLIRVEITRDVAGELWELSRGFDVGWHDPKFEGPMKICGFAFYVVNRLPEPGWRVMGIPD